MKTENGRISDAIKNIRDLRADDILKRLVELDEEQAALKTILRSIRAKERARTESDFAPVDPIAKPKKSKRLPHNV